MSALDEITALTSSSAMNAALRAGTEVVSGDQTITFTKYVRQVLPIDGSVYFVRADLAGDTSAPVQAQGSLHLTSDKQQDETETYSRVSVTFTSEQDVTQQFDGIAPTDVFIGQTTGDSASTAPIRFAFSRLGFYQNAGIFHYSGVAIYPHVLPQIVDALPVDVDPVVTNSLPAWLSLNDYAPFYGFGNAIPLYPSMLVPANLAPPYGAVHIPGDATEALASTPYLGPTSSHFQLARDRVVVTFYGVRSDAAQTFLDCALQYMRDYGVLGLMNAPVVRDEKSGQNDLSVLSTKKSIIFEVSYLQTSMRDIARQLIEKALVTATPKFPASFPPPDPLAP